MKGFKRKLAIVLAACMVLTTVLPAFAEEETGVPATVNEAAEEQISESVVIPEIETPKQEDEATPEEALYEDSEIENDIEEASPSE